MQQAYNLRAIDDQTRVLSRKVTARLSFLYGVMRQHLWIHRSVNCAVRVCLINALFVMYLQLLKKPLKCCYSNVALFFC